MADTPQADVLVCSCTRGVVWGYVLGDDDDDDVVLFRVGGTPLALPVPSTARWPKTRQEALDIGLRVLQAGYLRTRPRVSPEARHDVRALTLPEHV